MCLKLISFYALIFVKEKYLRIKNLKKKKNLNGLVYF